jgi:hypothetical protein
VTARALEDYCFTHHHLFAALDEEGRALVSTGKHIKPSQLPYQVTSGRGTLYSKKATRDSEFRNLTWLLPVITTGEKPLDDPKSQRVRAEGAQVRMAPIPVPPGAVGGIINRLGGTRDEIVRRAHVLARKVKKTLDENYGVAMPAYLKLLVPRRSSLKRYVRRTIDNFVKWARKLTTHGQVVLITLHRLQRIIKPRTIASAVVSELTNRGILIKSRDGETAHEIMIRGLHGQPVAAMSRSS